MTDIQVNLWKTPAPWFGLVSGTAAPIFALISAGVITWHIGLVLMIVPAALMVPLLKNLRRKDLQDIYGSKAMLHYNNRMLAASLAYVAGLLVAVAIHERFEPVPVITFLITLLPTAPALAMVAVMGRYLIEETDEYLRYRASLAALIGLGIVLCLGTIWGFLETFGLVPNIFAWWVVPVWAIGLGIGQATLARRDRNKEKT